MNRSTQNVSIQCEEIRVVELSFHLGDILPPGMNYTQNEDTVLKVTMHYSDLYGRPRRKTITLPATSIL